MIQFKGT